MKEEFLMHRLKFVYAIASGLLLTAAFPKIGISYLAWIALIPLLFSLKDASLKQVFRIGFIAGLCHYLSLLYWLSDTMRIYGYLPTYVAIPLLFLLASYLSLYFGAFALLSCRLYRKPMYCLILMPAIWVSLEYLRSFMLTGFPWGLIGYSQANHLYLIQIADIFGVWGVSFVIAFANAVGFLLILRLRSEISKRDAGISILSLLIVIAAILGYGYQQITTWTRKITDAPSINVSVVQGNIPQNEKWDPEFRASTTLKYIKLSLSAKEKRPDLVVVPESATPFYFGYHREPTEQILECIRNTNAYFLIGSPSFIEVGKGEEYYNSAYLVSPEGRFKGRYDKVHLVPYGEYVPLRKWMPFLGKMVAQVGDFSAGKKGLILEDGRFKLGVLICYEIIFPELSSSMADKGASLLVNITNDAWFGTSSGPYQHFDMAIFRAVENKRTVARAANTGISGFIDPIGRIKAATPLLKDAVETRNLPMIHQKTIYTRFGNWFPILCSVIGIGYLLLRLRFSEIFFY